MSAACKVEIQRFWQVNQVVTSYLLFTWLPRPALKSDLQYRTVFNLFTSSFFLLLFLARATDTESKKGHRKSTIQKQGDASMLLVMGLNL